MLESLCLDSPLEWHGESGECKWRIRKDGCLEISSKDTEGVLPTADEPLWRPYADAVKSVFVYSGVIAPEDFSNFFAGLENCKNFDLRGLDVSHVRNMSDLFCGCVRMEQLNIEGWDTSNVENMRSMFERCYTVKNIDFLNFNTGKVRDMGCMFKDCFKLYHLDMMDFDTSNVVKMDEMFANNFNLLLVDMSNFDMSKVEDISRAFSGCESLEYVDLHGVCTPSLRKATLMFNACSSLKHVDLGGFNLSQCPSTDRTDMLYGCTGLKTCELPVGETPKSMALDIDKHTVVNKHCGEDDVGRLGFDFDSDNVYGFFIDFVDEYDVE